MQHTEVTSNTVFSAKGAKIIMNYFVIINIKFKKKKNLIFWNRNQNSGCLGSRKGWGAV